MPVAEYRRAAHTRAVTRNISTTRLHEFATSLIRRRSAGAQLSLATIPRLAQSVRHSLKFDTPWGEFLYFQELVLVDVREVLACVASRPPDLDFHDFGVFAKTNMLL